jgi:hypothetical protein
VQGIPESGKWHLFEAKTINDKGFGVLKRDGLEKANPRYWAQVQIGMEMSGLPRTLHLTTNKNTDEIYGERIKPRQQEADRLMYRAERVIFSEEPLERISDRPDWYQCKFCPMAQVCHHGKAAAINCRTCVHSTAERDGTWSCARHGVNLSTREQRQGCDRHLLRPTLVPAEPLDAGDDWIQYEGWTNHCDGVSAGRHCYTSAEVRAAEKLPLDEGAEDIRQEFGGTVEG